VLLARHDEYHSQQGALVNFLVTSLWHDGWTNVEEHSTWEEAQAFIGEAMGCEGIVKVKVEKRMSFEEWDAAMRKLLATARRDERFAALGRLDDWDGSQPLT
jgi:hypothetical protein